MCLCWTIDISATHKQHPHASISFKPLFIAERKGNSIGSEPLPQAMSMWPMASILSERLVSEREADTFRASHFSNSTFNVSPSGYVFRKSRYIKAIAKIWDFLTNWRSEHNLFLGSSLLSTNFKWIKEHAEQYSVHCFCLCLWSSQNLHVNLYDLSPWNFYLSTFISHHAPTVLLIWFTPFASLCWVYPSCPGSPAGS